ncbi:MAG: iron-sulfur cluster assembly scaffold protein [Gammaproteobacteria bacterium]|nr:iron-sulfur cluster assembly scaffold protein [Gammaproteobacteria bacterium]MCP5423672.1 iron-sulfur cluster assembly scaffold protein [Gammaproteobacteria bacterium]
MGDGVIPLQPLARYSDLLREHFEHPRHVGTFAEDDRTVGTGWVGAPTLGNVIKLQIKVTPLGVITDVCFKAYGGVAAIALCSWVSEWLHGKTLDEAATMDNTRLAEQLSLPALEIQSAVWVERALRAALADYQRKASPTAR